MTRDDAQRAEEIARELRAGNNRLRALGLYEVAAINGEAADMIDALLSALAGSRTPFASTLSHEDALARLRAINVATYDLDRP